MENLNYQTQFKNIFDSFRDNPGIKLDYVIENRGNRILNGKGELVGFHVNAISTFPEASAGIVRKLSITSVNLGGIGGYETFSIADNVDPVPQLRSKLIQKFYEWLNNNSKTKDIIAIQDFPTILRYGELAPDFTKEVANLGYEVIIIPYVCHSTKINSVSFRGEAIGLLINRNKSPELNLEGISVIPHFQNQKHTNTKGDYLNWDKYYNIDPRNSKSLKENNPFWGQTLLLTFRDRNNRTIQIGTFYISPASSAIDRRRSLRRTIEIANNSLHQYFICGDTNMYGVKIDTSKPLIERPLLRSYPFKIALLTLLGGISITGTSLSNLGELSSLKKALRSLKARLSVPITPTLTKGPIKWLLDVGITNTNTSDPITNSVNFTDHKEVIWEIDLN